MSPEGRINVNSYIGLFSAATMVWVPHAWGKGKAVFIVAKKAES